MKSLGLYKILRTYRFRLLSSGEKIRQVVCKKDTKIKNLSIQYSWESLFQQSDKNIHQETKEYTEKDVLFLLQKSRKSWEKLRHFFDILEKKDKNYYLWFCVALKTSFLKKVNVNGYYKKKGNLRAEESLKGIQYSFFPDIKEFFKEQHQVVLKNLEQIDLYQKEQKEGFAPHLKNVTKIAYFESVKKVFEKTKYLYWLLEENFRVVKEDNRLLEKEKEFLTLFDTEKIKEKKTEIENILGIYSDKTGVYLFSGGFNRFILDKKSKIYDKDIANLKKSIKELEEKKWNMKYSQEFFKKACESLIGINLRDTSNKKLDILKGQTPFEVIKNFCVLDKKNFDDNFVQKYKKISKSIKILNQKIQQLESEEGRKKEIGDKKEERTKLKKLRGNLFKILHSYRSWEQEYKKVSQQLGSAQSTVKQKEFLQNKIIYFQYYTSIIQYKGFYFILGIPKEKREILLNEFRNKNNSSGITAYQFHSLMARSLEFLIFIDKALNLKEEKEYNFLQAEKIFQKKKFLLEHDYQKWQNNKNFLIEFYQKVLIKSHLVEQSGWKIFNFKFRSPLKYKTLDEFYADIDRQGYLIEEKYFSANFLAKVVNEYKGFLMPIYNRDFAPKRNPNKKLMQTRYFEEVFSKENKKKDYPIRLGPESKIFHRPVLEKREAEKAGYEKNRFFRKEFHLHFNIELNGNLPLPSTKTEEYIQHIKSFSKSIIQRIKEQENYYFYGIDRGLNEIATLCVLDKNGGFVYTDENYNHISKETKGARPLIMDLSDKVVMNNKIIENKNMAEIVKKDLDYRRLIKVLNEKDYLTEENIKDINKVITNFENDNLEKKSKEYTKVFNKIIQKVFGENAGLKGEKTEVHLYELQKIFQEWQKKRDTIKDTRKFVLELPKSLDRKNAIAGNIAGVLAFLMRKLPGFIIFENLDFQKDEKDKKETTHKEQEIERWAGSVLYQQIETALMRKFQYMNESSKSTKGIQLVPFLKNLNILKQMARKKEDWQFGNFLYIPAEYTSKMCPKCFKIAERRRDNKIVCKNCGYDMSENHTLPLKNGDQNAAYHIARIGRKKFLEDF